MKYNNAKKQAYQLLKKYAICNITIDNLIYIIEEQGYEFIKFSLDESDESYSILENLNLLEISHSNIGFTCTCNDVKITFIRNNLSNDEMLYVLSHEAGHILCGHMEKHNVSANNISDEKEANEFAHYLLNPSIVQKTTNWLMQNKKIAIIIVLLTTLIISGSIILPKIFNDTSYYGNYYVTENGEKFHRKDCQTIKGRSAVREITAKEIERKNYEPCKVCRPND